MKKILMSLVVVATTLSIVACNSGGGGNGNTLGLSVNGSATCDLSDPNSTISMTVNGLFNGDTYYYGYWEGNTITVRGDNPYNATGNTMTNNVPCADINYLSGTYQVGVMDVYGNTSNTVQITVTGGLPLQSQSNKTVLKQYNLSEIQEMRNSTKNATSK